MIGATEEIHQGLGARAVPSNVHELPWGALSLDTKSYPIHCDPMDCSPPGSSIHRIPQARILQWIAISFFTGPSPLRDQTRVSYVGVQVLYHDSPGKPAEKVLGRLAKLKTARPAFQSSWSRLAVRLGDLLV